MDDFNRAIGINPGLAVAYLNRGVVHLLQGETVESEKDFDHCLRLDPQMKRALEQSVSKVRELLKKE
jgi:hypothetical protein